MLPRLAGVLTAAALIGVGTGLIAPLGFAALSASAAPEHLGQTMARSNWDRQPGAPHDARGPTRAAVGL